MEETRVVHKTELGTLVGPVWLAGWLFTVGYAGLHWPKILWAIVIWPYYLGRLLAH